MRRTGCEKATRDLEFGGRIPRGQQAVVPDFDVSGWQDMLQEPADELMGREGGRPVASRAERDSVVRDLEEAVVGYAYTISISAEVSQHLLWTGKRLPAVGDPVLFVKIIPESREGLGLCELGTRAGEVQLGEFVCR